MLQPPTLEQCAPSAPTPIAPSVLRRLTRVEYTRTLADLTYAPPQDLEAFTAQLPPDEEVLGFDNQATSLQVSATHIEGYMKVAEQVAWRVADEVASHAGCEPTDEGDVMCVRAFVEAFGARAWRRPLEASEVERLMGVYASAVEGAQADLASPDAHLLGVISPLRDGLTSLVVALLQSPNFLYRVERGRALTNAERSLVTPLKGEGEVYGLTPYELASRLSYLLWRSMPDEALFEAAERGELSDEASLMAQVERMMADPRAAEGLWSFFEQWLALDEVARVTKDPERFPGYSEALNVLLATEARLFVEEVVFRERDMRQLYNGTFSFQNRTLASYYAQGGEGVSAPASLEASLEWAEEHRTGATPVPNGEVFERVELNPARRPGIMTRGAVLALTTKPNMGDPVHRGLYVRERLLCTPLPPPPPDIVVVAPDPDPTLTTREQFAIHSAEPACEGCHRLMDPLAWGFERFDASGRWRESENGKPIDERGEVVSTLDLDGPYEGPVELTNQLADSEQVQRCVVLNFTRYAQGRAEQAEEVCAVNSLYERFEGEGYDFLSLLRAFVSAPSFRFLHVDEAPSAQADERHPTDETQEEG